MNQFLDVIFKNEKNKYVYTFLCVLLAAISFFIMQQEPRTDIVFTFGGLFFVLLPVSIASFASLLLKQNDYMFWFKNTSIFILVSILGIFIAPFSDVSSGGMLGFEKGSLSIVLLTLYTLVALYFFSTRFYQKFLRGE